MFSSPRTLTRVAACAVAVTLVSSATGNADAASLKTVRVTASAQATVSATRSATATMSATAVAPAKDGAPIRVTRSATATRVGTSSATSSSTRTSSARARTKAKAKAAARSRARKAAAATARQRAAAAAARAAAGKALAAAQAAAKALALSTASAQAMSQAGGAAATPAPSDPGMPQEPTSAEAGTTDPSTPCGDSPAPVMAGRVMTCSFDEEFNGTALDPAKWVPLTTYQVGVFSGAENERGCYTDDPANLSVGNGALSLTARRVDTPFTCGWGDAAFETRLSSAEVVSHDRFNQTYGRFAIRAKFPASTVAGLHSALWLWPQNPTGPRGEIDIVEWYSLHPSLVAPTTHYDFDLNTVDPVTQVNNATTWSCSMATASSAFHEYAVEWTPTRFVFKYDGKTCLTNNIQPNGPSPFDQPYFLALTQAFGGSDNTIDPDKPMAPGTTMVDWVRVWK